MLEISRLLEIVILMYFTDHPPPHFHAVDGDDHAQIRIDPVGLLSGSLSPRALALVVEWAKLHQAELLENWTRLRSGQHPARIAPLERGMHPRVTAVEVIRHWVVSLSFRDGTRGVVDIRQIIGKPRGVFLPFEDPRFFAQVRVDAELGTIVWPNEVDLDPDVLYDRAHGLNVLTIDSGAEPADLREP